MRIELVELFDEFQRGQGFTPNLRMREEEDWVREEEANLHLGYFCMWLAEQWSLSDINAIDSDEWCVLFEHIGVEPGDGAENVALTLSKIPA